MCSGTTGEEQVPVIGDPLEDLMLTAHRVSSCCIADTVERDLRTGWN